MSWETHSDYEIPQEHVFWCFDRKNRMPFYERGQMVKVDLRLHYSTVDYMDQRVQSGKDPLWKTRTDMARDLIDLGLQHDKERDIDLESNRHLIIYELAKQKSMVQRDLEFVEDIKSMYDLGRSKGSKDIMEMARTLAYSRTRGDCNDVLCRELGALIGQIDSSLSLMV